jgi:hypothetical protein
MDSRIGTGSSFDKLYQYRRIATSRKVSELVRMRALLATRLPWGFRVVFAGVNAHGT